MLFTHFTVDQSKLTVNGSVLSDTPNVRYLVALYEAGKMCNIISKNSSKVTDFAALRPKHTKSVVHHDLL